MQIDKQRIIDLLRGQGDDQQADQAESELPPQVDTEQHGDLLSRLGIDPQQLTSGFGGQGGIPGL